MIVFEVLKTLVSKTMVSSSGVVLAWFTEYLKLPGPSSFVFATVKVAAFPTVENEKILNTIKIIEKIEWLIGLWKLKKYIRKPFFIGIDT